jgi:hypothetical protein
MIRANNPPGYAICSGCCSSEITMLLVLNATISTFIHYSVALNVGITGVVAVDIVPQKRCHVEHTLYTPLPHERLTRRVITLMIPAFWSTVQDVNADTALTCED